MTDADFSVPETVRAVLPEEALSAFVGEDPNGTWRLTVVDMIDDANSGTLTEWRLDATTPAVFNLTQSMTATPSVVQPGGPVSFTASISNTGPDPVFVPDRVDAPVAARRPEHRALHEHRRPRRLDVYYPRGWSRVA